MAGSTPHWICNYTRAFCCYLPGIQQSQEIEDEHKRCFFGGATGCGFMKLKEATVALVVARYLEHLGGLVLICFKFHS